MKWSSKSLFDVDEDYLWQDFLNGPVIAYLKNIWNKLTYINCYHWCFSFIYFYLKYKSLRILIKRVEIDDASFIAKKEMAYLAS